MNAPEDYLKNATVIPLDGDNVQRKGFRASPFQFGDEASIPRRQWVYGYHLIRKFVSVTIAPGGLGKSNQVLAEAVAMASGKPILEQPVSDPLKVWLWNLEDPQDELKRRLAGIAKHYKITQDDIGDRLFIDSGREQELCLAIAGQKGPEVQQEVFDNLICEIKSNGIDVLILDPFISSHALDENSNPAMDMVVKTWGKIADRTGIAVSIVHHTRKQSTDSDVSADSARGAKALVDAARDVRCLTRMTEEEAQKANVDNYRLYYRVYSDKANLAPPADKSEWYKLEDISLSNGDNVGVVTRWKWPDPFNDITVHDLKRVQLSVDGKQYRENSQAKEWVGHTIAKVLEWDANDPAIKSKIKSCIATWIASDALRVVSMTDDKGKKRPIIEVGEWA